MSLEFTESILASCFPFYISVDGSWKLEAMGPSLERTLGSEAIGENLGSVFDISKPITKAAPTNPKKTPSHLFHVIFSFKIGPAKAFVNTG